MYAVKASFKGMVVSRTRLNLYPRYNHSYPHVSLLTTSENWEEDSRWLSKNDLNKKHNVEDDDFLFLWMYMSLHLKLRIYYKFEDLSMLYGCSNAPSQIYVQFKLCTRGSCKWCGHYYSITRCVFQEYKPI